VKFIAPIAMAVGAAGLLALGCERRRPAPATRPATQAAATRPATQPSLCRLLINGQVLEFPRARLRLVHTQPKVMVRLFSDDPRQAIDRDYHGNSFYFEMELDTTDPADIGQMVWGFEAASSERMDSSNGVFLDGGRQHLQPFRAQIAFEPAGPGLLMHVRGTFLLFRSRDLQLAERVLVEGRLWAELEK